MLSSTEFEQAAQFVRRQLADPGLAAAHRHLGQFTLAAHHRVDALLEAALGDQTAHLDVALLPDTLGAVRGPGFDGRFPPPATTAHPTKCGRTGAGPSGGQTAPAGASTTFSPLSRAKFITKSQAIGSMSFSASLTITHLMLSTTRGTQ